MQKNGREKKGRGRKERWGQEIKRKLIEFFIMDFSNQILRLYGIWCVEEILIGRDQVYKRVKIRREMDVVKLELGRIWMKREMREQKFEVLMVFRMF